MEVQPCKRAPPMPDPKVPLEAEAQWTHCLESRKEMINRNPTSKNSGKDKVIDLKDDLNLPTSFQQDIAEEMLWDNQQPFMLWATLKILLPDSLGNEADEMFDCLVNFIEAASKEDKQFIIFS